MEKSDMTQGSVWRLVWKMTVPMVVAKAEKLLGTCVIPLIILGGVLTILLLLFGSKILPLFGATKTNMPYAISYLNIVSIGIVFNMLATGLNLFINTQGKTLIGMMSILIGAVIIVTIVLNFVLKKYGAVALAG